jgi:hypothetical protein
VKHSQQTLKIERSLFLRFVEPVAKRQFCDFNGVDRLCQNEAGRDFGADGEIEGADKNGVLQLPLLTINLH